MGTLISNDYIRFAKFQFYDEELYPLAHPAFATLCFVGAGRSQNKNRQYQKGEKKERFAT